MRTMTAKFRSVCKGCRGWIQPGSRIRWSKREGAFHFNCAPSADPKEDAEYQQGRAEGERYSNDVRMYGRELAEQFAMEEELARWNRGDDY